MPAIISNSLRLLNADALESRIKEQPTYLFIGKNTPWPDEEIPATLFDTDEEKTALFKNIQAVKRVPPNSILSVVPRFNWTENAIYDFYDHRINMIDSRKPNGQRYQFYVMTDEFNVYKCLSNNKGVPSTVKPTSQQISPFQTSDGYIWKYMYTVRSSDVFSYLTQDWMPIYTVEVNDGSSQWVVQESAIDGGIHTILVDVGGVGYNAAVPPNVIITGDGVGAQATAQVDPFSGAITRIIVTDPGYGYTSVTVSFNNVGLGVGAQATAILSPVGGHGKNARLELGGTTKMIKFTTSGTEGGNFPVTSFRQAGLIYMPMSTKQGTKLTVANANGFAVGDELVGGTSGAVGTISIIEPNGRIVWLDNVTGDYIQAETITNGDVTTTSSWVVNDTNTPLTDLVANVSGTIPRTGEVLYISNRVKIERNETQSEEIRFVIQF